jgi:hypothetical protein
VLFSPTASMVHGRTGSLTGSQTTIPTTQAIAAEAVTPSPATRAEIGMPGTVDHTRAQRDPSLTSLSQVAVNSPRSPVLG